MGPDVAAFPALAGARQGGPSSFRYSFSFLPKPKREAIKVLYAFCRTTDDIVDNQADQTKKIEVLRHWRSELEQALVGESSYPVLNRLSAMAKKFNIPVHYFYELLRGVEMDLVKSRFESFEELKEYCYLVASTVGLMSIEIFGPRSERSREYAVNLGIALQLTNIIRDVGIDARYGRIYLPQEDLRRFGYTEEDLFANRYTPQFTALMEYESSRAMEYFSRAQESLPREDRRVMFPAKIMERIYFHILLRIREARYNIFEKPVSLPRLLQFLIAVKYWVKQRIFGR